MEQSTRATRSGGERARLLSCHTHRVLCVRKVSFRPYVDLGSIAPTPALSLSFLVQKDEAQCFCLRSSSSALVHCSSQNGVYLPGVRHNTPRLSQRFLQYWGWRRAAIDSVPVPQEPSEVSVLLANSRGLYTPRLIIF